MVLGLGCGFGQLLVQCVPDLFGLYVCSGYLLRFLYGAFHAQLLAILCHKQKSEPYIDVALFFVVLYHLLEGMEATCLLLGIQLHVNKLCCISHICHGLQLFCSLIFVFAVGIAAACADVNAARI